VKSEALVLDKPFLFALAPGDGLMLLSGYLGQIPNEVTQ
jgi:hypothetical protein